jgi:hypothetical protein
MNNNPSEDQYARCKQIKYRMVNTNTTTNIYNNAATNQLIGAQQSAEMDNLNRAYKENNCY